MTQPSARHKRYHCMHTMSARICPRPSRHRILTSLVATIAGVAVLAGCGSNSVEAWDSSAAFDGGADPYAYAAVVPSEAVDGASIRSSETAHDRAIIVTGHLYMTVEDPIGSADRVAEIIAGAGGRIDERGEVAPRDRSGGSAYLTVRIPTQRLDSVVSQLRTLGTVDDFATSRHDVTNEVTDLEARISTLRSSTTRIEQLLDTAEDITDIITLENELARRQAELESLEARQRGLDDQVAMSTIHMSLTTEPVVDVDDSPDSFWDAIGKGWDGLVSFVGAAIVTLGLALPALGALALVLIVITWLVRARLKRRAAVKATDAHLDTVNT